MRDFQPIGPYADVISVPSPNDRNRFLSRDRERFVNLGLLDQTIDRFRRFGLATTIAQYYGNVQEGLFFVDDVVHLFRGLERPLMHLDNVRGDQDVLVYSWVPRWNWAWDHATQYPDPTSPPPNRVFIVNARPLAERDEYGVDGVVLHWAWVHEDPTLKGAPLDSATRFTETVWSKRKQ